MGENLQRMIAIGNRLLTGEMVTAAPVNSPNPAADRQTKSDADRTELHGEEPDVAEKSWRLGWVRNRQTSDRATSKCRVIESPDRRTSRIRTAHMPASVEERDAR